jgi:lysophospholipase L1-like esterase
MIIPRTLLLILLVGGLLMSQGADAAPKLRLLPTDGRLHYSDYVRLTLTPEAAVFDRLLDNSAGMQRDAPGARVRFSTNADSVTMLLCSTTPHTHPARNAIACALIDGKPAASFDLNELGDHALTLPPNPQRRQRLIEVVPPYAAACELRWVEVDADATFGPVPERPHVRYVAYGDSITHGFRATDPTGSYPFRIGELNHYEVVNMGFGSRWAVPTDGTVLGHLCGDVISILIGYNDFAGHQPLADYTKAVTDLLANIRVTQPQVPIFICSPLWSSSVGTPALDEYRQAVRRVVEKSTDPNLHFVDGLSLSDPNPALYPDGVHPNDAGFAQIAERLGKILAAAVPGH